MILDSIDHVATYSHMGLGFTFGLELIQEPWLVNAEPGRYETLMPGIYLLIQDYKAKPKAETRWEAHNKHVDIQFIMRGAEAMGHAFRPTLNVEETYDPENDVAFYTGSGNLFRVDQGMFVIFFPQDAHRPGRMIGGPTAVRKVVVKIPVHYFPNVHIPPKM